MADVVFQAFITLDGVVQGPGAPDEDRDGGFGHGGWTSPIDALDSTDEGTSIIRGWEEKTGALILGRRTYEIWANAWGVWDESEPGIIGEFTRRYNRVTKHVASRSLTELHWKNSELLGSDVPASVARLKGEPLDGEIRIWGSTRVVRTLAEHDLIDEYRLMIYPLVLGSGKKLFPDGFPLTRLRLVESTTLESGVQLVVYRRSDA